MANKKPGIQIPAWKRKYNEAYFEAGNRIPDGKSARSYNTEFGEIHKIPYGTVSSHYSKLIKEHLPQSDEPTGKKKQGAPLKALEWKDQIVSDIEAGTVPEKATNYVNQVALAFGINDKTVKAYYYKQLAERKKNKEIEGLKILTDALKEPAEEAPPIIEEVEEPKKTPLHPGYTYRKGSIVKVKVVRIESGHVLVETQDEYKLTGIIHISNITNGYISDINKWFKLGLELNAQVIEYTELDGGRLNLSTRNLVFTAYSWKYNKVQEKLKKQLDNESLPYQEKLTEIASQLFKTETVKPKGEEPNMEQEWKQAKPFIESMIGTITEAAEVEMKKIMVETGVFAFTVALMGKKDNFTPDIGLMLAQAIRKDLIPAQKEFPR